MTDNFGKRRFFNTVHCYSSTMILHNITRAHKLTNFFFEEILNALTKPLREVRMWKFDRKNLNRFDHLDFQRIVPSLQILLRAGTRQMLS